MPDNLKQAAQRVVDWAWQDENSMGAVHATIPWDLLWNLRDSLAQEDQHELNRIKLQKRCGVYKGN
jgi:hypothetical protein